VFFTRPISATLIAVAVVVLAGPRSRVRCGARRTAGRDVGERAVRRRRARRRQRGARCGAHRAARGARVLVLERAPRHFRGGNSRTSRNLRCAHARRRTSSPTVLARGACSTTSCA
jgi:hypothetical protein